MNKKGFTLLELAIVLIIVGVLSAGAMKILFGAFNNNKQTATKNNIALIVKDIAAYTVKGRRLPAELDQATSQENDAFGNPLVYRFAENLSGIDICSVQTADLSINGAVTENNIAFLVISHGEDGQQQYAVSGNTYTFNNGDDDVVGWMNLGTLQAMAGCDGALGIEQNKLPDAIVFNKYEYKLTPKGGTSPFRWCVESNDDTIVQEDFYYNQTKTDGNKIKDSGKCGNSDYIESDGAIYIHTDDKPLKEDKNVDELNNSIGSASITVKLKDNNNIEFSKQYQLRILRPFEVAMEAPTGGGGNDIPEAPYEGFSNFESTHGDSINSNKNDPSAKITTDELQIVQNNSDRTMAVFINCDPNTPNVAPCPKFENHGILSVYFDYNFVRNPLNKWNDSNKMKYFGFVFAVIKSYKPGSSNTSANSTKNERGTENGLGYGGNDSPEGMGINGGNSFAMEFDLHKGSSDSNNSYVLDPDGDHLAIISRVDIKQTWWGNGHNIPAYDTITEGIYTYRVYNPEQSYVSHATNAHSSTTGDANHYFSHNDDSAGLASGKTGTGLYYDTFKEIIPNNYGVTPAVIYGIRLEAVSGCNYSCTVCDKQTGRNNFISIKVWRASEAEMNSSATKYNMQNVNISHTYNNIKDKTIFPLGEPLIKDCVPDDYTTNNKLDTIRFGFTSAKDEDNSYDDRTAYKITNFKASVTQY